MTEVHLKNQTSDGAILRATFLPEDGMNLKSFKRNNIEVIEQSTINLFTERKAGLGALIGPHFHQQDYVAKELNDSIFPHIALSKKQGRKDPLSHGIARYVPWNYQASTTQIKAKLTGRDSYKGIPLKTFEGQDFILTFEARLLSDGLTIKYCVESEKPSVIGLHYYYRFQETGLIHGHFENLFRDQNQWIEIPKKWKKNGDNSLLNIKLPQALDYGFVPHRKDFHSPYYHLIYLLDP